MCSFILMQIKNKGIFKIYLYYFNYVHVQLSGYVHHEHVGATVLAELAGIEVMGSRELTDVSAQNKTESSARAEHTLNC